MRIIGGTLRSRTLQAPTGLATRPTSDRLRETLFNVLAPRIEGAAFLDLYAGSGAVGIEALSRGAEHVVFVERGPAALKMLRTNLEKLGIARGFHVESGSVTSFMRRARAWSFDIIFLDPPYDADAEYESTLNLLGDKACAVLAEGSIVIVEHRRKTPLDGRYGLLARTRLLEQGDASLSFYMVSEG